jgi:uncharacterized protein YqgC (DUF456 family)
MSSDPWLWLLACVMVLTGIAGAVLPALPGTPLVFAGMVLAAWIDDFQRVGWITLTVLGLLTALSMVVDFMAGVLGARRVGASGLAVLGATLGALGGIFLGLPGMVFGPFVGALVGELIARRNAMAAGKVALGTWLGILVGTVLKLALVFAMLAIFLASYLL